MNTFNEVNQVRLALKMKLANYGWYQASEVSCSNGDYYITVFVNRLNNQIRKIIPPVINGINVKTEEKSN